MLRSVLLLIILVFMLVGCDKEDEYIRKLEIQESQILNLQIILAGKDQEIKQIKEEAARSNVALSEMDYKLQEYPWLKKLQASTQWDKVVVYRYENDPEMKTIENPLFLENINWLLHIKGLGIDSYPSGYQTDIDTYTYEFYEGNTKYTINVVDRGVIEAGRNQLYFEVDKDIHQLGSAFMPNRPFIKHDGLIAKMAASGAVRRGDQSVHFSSFRVQSRIAPLIGGEILKNQPDKIGEKIERYTFYYYGTELVMDIYKDYVNLSGDGSVEWYYYKGAGIGFTVEPG